MGFCYNILNVYKPKILCCLRAYHSEARSKIGSNGGSLYGKALATGTGTRSIGIVKFKAFSGQSVRII